MFTALYSVRYIILVFCTCILLGALPLVVRSEYIETPEQGTFGNEAATVSISNDTNVEPYMTEGIPGDGGVIGDFVVGPGKFDLTLNPGESKTVEMTITNRTGERRIFKLGVEDAQGSYDPESPVLLLGDTKGPFSLKDYVSFTSSSFELDHNERALVPVTISIPPNAEPGGLYGSVLVNTVAIEAEQGNTGGTVPQSAIVARIGTLFFVTIPGDVYRDGSMTKFGTISDQKFFQEGPIRFGILFENKGSIHVAPYGEIKVTNIFGEEVGFVELEPWFVFPQSERLREVTWNRELLIGRYTATAQINRSYDDVVDTMTYSFWVLPWKLMLVAFGIVFVIVFIVRAFFRTFEFKRRDN
jgi:hypothetical protein